MKNRVSKGPFVTILLCSLVLRFISLLITTSPFAEGADELQGLPPQALDMAALASTHHVRQFALSESLLNAPAPTQRFIEFLYPIKFIDGTSSVFAHISESMPPHCRHIDAKGDIVLYDCQQQ